MSVNWAEVWAFLWPILKQGLIALLVSVLAMLGYDKVVPSRYARRANVAGTPEQFVRVKGAKEADARALRMIEGLKLGRQGPRLDDGETQRARRA